VEGRSTIRAPPKRGVLVNETILEVWVYELCEMKGLDGVEGVDIWGVTL
jgi:hypothetical protein